MIVPNAKKKYVVFVLLICVILLHVCSLNIYAKDSVLPPKVNINEEGNVASRKGIDNCLAILTAGNVATLSINHIGVIDKPIKNIILVSGDRVAPRVAEENRDNELATLKGSEMQCICDLFWNGHFYTKVYDESLEQGSFLFKMAMNQHDEKSFKTNRKNSIQLFQQIISCIQNNDKARELIKINLQRIRY